MIDDLNRFIDQALAEPSSCANTHIRGGGSYIYLRVGARFLDGVRAPCIDLADACFKNRGQGRFTAILTHLEFRYGDFCSLYMENILNPRLERFFERRPGYYRRTDLGDIPSFYRLPTVRPIGYEKGSNTDNA